MIKHSAFVIEDWSIREVGLQLDILAQSESLFALSNGHIGLRGNLDEGEPCGQPGTYLNSFYELHPLPYAEIGYGYPESGQAIINVTNGKLIRLLIDDEPFDVRYGEVQEQERELDLRAGVLCRKVCWTSPAGRTVKVSSVRMVSFTQRAIAAIHYEVEAVDMPIRVVVQSELVANEALPTPEKDPRTGTVLASPLISEEHQARDTIGLLVHRTQASGLRVAAAMEHIIEGPAERVVEAESSADIARVSVAARLQPGERLRIVKFVAYGWSRRRSRSALHDQVDAAIAAARLTGWEGLLAEQRAYLEEFWSHADIEIEGDPEIQQALRFALFHVLQAGARGERRPIAAKGLTGSGYSGHTFWDMEIFVLPVLIFTTPRAAADALRWRYSILDKARDRARLLGLRGAAFPWRTIAGEECSGYWPASTAAFHINAAIAYAVTLYVESTGDTEFEKTIGLELLVETARLWQSLGCFSAAGQFRIDGVTGPDEYSALVDNNVYTNLMAQLNLHAAAEVAKRYPDRARALGVDADEAESWQHAARSMYLPYDERLGITPQDDSFTEHEVWDFANTSPDQYPLLRYFTYFDLYRRQVVKQADLVLALYLRGDAFTLEQKARNFAYYEPLTVRDSALSAAPQAVIAAEVGQLQLAYDYLGEVALMDLNDLERNVRDGVHLASLAGTWMVMVAGFGGMRVQNGALIFAPRLPVAITRLGFCILFRGSRLRVEVTAKEATYRLLTGTPLRIYHHGEEITVPADQAVTRPIPTIHVGPRPSQPPGREPLRRRAH
ncbi:MAG: glycoside hydrolase family 65 protein [Ktedonobacteraceae bacterium]|nr:glycoside hydrolase family 65 protein [Ktedonobacteraceae bacterium]